MLHYFRSILIISIVFLLVSFWGLMQVGPLPVGFASRGNIAIEDFQPFYQARCKELADKISANYKLLLYDPAQQIFPTYYQSCQNQLNDLPRQKVGNYLILN